MKTCSLYFDFITIKIKSMAEYPVAFWTHAIAKMMGWGADIVVIYLMVRRFNGIFSWTPYEVLLLYTLNIMAYSLAGFWVYHPFERLSEHIQMGTFDEILTKPLSPFWYLCFKEFSTGYIGNIIITGIALVVCIVKLELFINPSSVLWIGATLFGGMLIHASLLILFNIPAFWTTKATAFKSLKWSLVEFINYPLSIYNKWVQTMLTLIIPVAFINFYPAQILLDKTDYCGFNPNIAYLSPIIGVVLFTISYYLFSLGIKHYKSTGT